MHALIAHQDQEICQQLLSRLKHLPVQTWVCKEPQEVKQHLNGNTPCLLLIDVAFAGGFPFELIEQAKRKRNGIEHKVVLLPSVYNKTAYKKKPTSLYGADTYLELHHIGDQLLPTLAGLFPQLSEKAAVCADSATVAGERTLIQTDLREQALALSRLLMADIALYHQDRLKSARGKQEARELLADFLNEGRQLLLKRLPEASTLPDDCLQLAFDELYEAYLSHRGKI